MTGKATTIGVLAVQGDYEAHSAAFAELGMATCPVKTVEDLAGVTALVMPGGESTAMLRLLKRSGLDASLREFVRKQPVFATCAGCILLARQVLHPEQESFAALDVTVERNAYGRQNESAICMVETTLPGGDLEAVFIRAPRIQQMGPSVEALAWRDGFPVLVRQGGILAATFHPELASDRRIHQLFLQMVETNLQQNTSNFRA